MCGTWAQPFGIIAQPTSPFMQLHYSTPETAVTALRASDLTKNLNYFPYARSPETIAANPNLNKGQYDIHVILYNAEEFRCVTATSAYSILCVTSSVQPCISCALNSLQPSFSSINSGFLLK
jgi:hypothetical protein